MEAGTLNFWEMEAGTLNFWEMAAFSSLGMERQNSAAALKRSTCFSSDPSGASSFSSFSCIRSNCAMVSPSLHHAEQPHRCSDAHSA